MIKNSGGDLDIRKKLKEWTLLLHSQKRGLGREEGTEFTSRADEVLQSDTTGFRQQAARWAGVSRERGEKQQKKENCGLTASFGNEHGVFGWVKGDSLI